MSVLITYSLLMYIWLYVPYTSLSLPYMYGSSPADWWLAGLQWSYTLLEISL